MKKSLYDSYFAQGWKLFKLIYVGENGNAVKGKYMTPASWNDMSLPSDGYSEKAVYGGVPPSDMMVLDVDVKNGKNGASSYQDFLCDVNLSLDTMCSNVVTPSGGYHVYVGIEDGELYKKRQSKYPDIDFIVHGREFIVLGGQNIEGYGEYEIVSTDKRFIFNKELDSFLEKRLAYSKSSYEDIDEFEHMSDRPKEYEVIAFLDKIDPDLGYDEGWRDVVMALNHWDLGGERGFELLKEWNEKSTFYNMDEDELREKYEQNQASAPNFYNKLVGLANKSDKQSFGNRIDKAVNTKELTEILEDIQYSTLDNGKRLEFGKQIQDKWNKVEKSDPLHRKPTDKTLPSRVAKKTNAESVPENDIPQIFMVGTMNYILEGKTLMKDIAVGGLKKVLKNMGYKEGEIEAGIAKTKQVVELKETPDYLIEDDLVHELKQIEAKGLYEMIVKHNPLYDWVGLATDEAIENDFFQTLWKGKVDDIVKIIALSIKTGERKLNRLMIVAPSNTGKTEIFNHLGFQKIVMKRLVSAMNGDKGVGSQIIDGLKRSGFMLIDEANTALTSEIKDMDKELHIDQFGKGGTQVIPLMFTALTSTHATATRNASDELYNRFLQVELNQPDYTLNDSELFKENRDRYSEVVKTYMINLFLDTLGGSEGKKELHALQEKYRLPLNSDLDEFLYEVSEKIITFIKTTAGYDTNILVRAGEYFLVRKKELSDTITDMLKELPSIDHGKYAEKLMKHFITDDKKSVRVGDTIKKVYPINLVTFTADKEQQIKDMFDDLDLEDL